MGRSSAAEVVRCSKHPKHKQSTGVCSLCLREKLSRLHSTSNNNARAFCSSSQSSSSSSPYSSAASYCSYTSSCSSPVYHHHHYYSATFSMPLSRKAIKGGDGVVIMRSRSMAVQQLGDDQGKKISNVSREVARKKKSGFWSKLLLGLAGKRRKEEVLMVDSSSMREKRAKMLY